MSSLRKCCAVCTKRCASEEQRTKAVRLPRIGELAMVLPRACSLLFAVASLLACGGSTEGEPMIAPPTGGNADDDGGDEPELDCGPTSEGDLVLEYGDRSEAPDEIVGVVSVGGVAVIGGDGCAAVGGGDALEVSGVVRALAAGGDRSVALGSSSGEVVIAAVEGDALVQTRSVSVGSGVRGLTSDGAMIWAALGAAGLHALAVASGEASRFGDVAVARGVALAGSR